MKVKELIERLQKQDPEKEIMILDGFNGGGEPREINLGPKGRTISEQDADQSADCEDLIGKDVLVMGYGFY